MYFKDAHKAEFKCSKICVITMPINYFGPHGSLSIKVNFIIMYIVYNCLVLVMISSIEMYRTPPSLYPLRNLDFVRIFYKFDQDLMIFLIEPKCPKIVFDLF